MASEPEDPSSIAVATRPSDAETIAQWKPDPDSVAGRIEAELQELRVVKDLSADTNWKACRGHLKIPPSLQSTSFMGSHLLSDDKVPVPPMVFTDDHKNRLISVTYLGKSLCGHPGVVHGGMLATLLDEGFARACSGAISGKNGVTANLTINYRAPCHVDQFVVMRAETFKIEGRKIWVKGRIESLPLSDSPGTLFVEAEGLFFEPKAYVER
jgi:acyl-coenzyme A thioesterase PaaI-like protein